MGLDFDTSTCSSSSSYLQCGLGEDILTQRRNLCTTCLLCKGGRRRWDAISNQNVMPWIWVRVRSCMISIQHKDENMLAILLMSFRGERQPSIHWMCKGRGRRREAGEETLSTERGILTSRLKGYGLVCCNFKAEVKQSLWQVITLADSSGCTVTANFSDIMVIYSSSG